MPFKSKAQMRKFFAMYNRGEISKQTLDKWLKHTKNKKDLPERVKKSVDHKQIIELDGQYIPINDKKIAYAFFAKIASNLNIKDPNELQIIVDGFKNTILADQKKDFDANAITKAANLMIQKMTENGYIDGLRKIGCELNRLIETEKLETLNKSAAGATGATGQGGIWSAAVSKVPALGSLAAMGSWGVTSALAVLGGIAIIGSGIIPYILGSFTGKALAENKNQEIETRADALGRSTIAAYLEAKTKRLKQEKELKKRLEMYKSQHPDTEIIAL